MTVDLACLVVNALWGLFLVFLEIGGKTRAAGAEWNAGNREGDPKVPEWVARTGRALANHKENFPLFLTAVLVVHVTGHAGRASAVASVVYAVARAGHGLVYVAGITKVRSLLFLVSIGAVIALFARLLA